MGECDVSAGKLLPGWSYHDTFCTHGVLCTGTFHFTYNMAKRETQLNRTVVWLMLVSVKLIPKMNQGICRQNF